MGLRCFVLGVTCLAYTLGQGNLGGLTGSVTDSSGASVPDASIQIHNLDTGQDSKAGTSSDGAFLASNLAPARYRVVVSKTGFRTSVRESVLVSTATVTTADFTLSLGSTTESVVVSGSDVQLQTTSAEIGTVLPTKAILDLPISMGGAATTGATGRRQIENLCS